MRSTELADDVKRDGSHDESTSPTEAGAPAAGWKAVAVIVVVVVLVPLVITFAASRRGGDADPTPTTGAPRSRAVRAALTSDDSSCYDRPPPATQPVPSVTAAGSGAVVGLPHFTEVTKAAGLCHLQHEYHDPPNCFFNAPSDVPGDNIDDAARFYLKCVERMTGGVAVGDFDGDGRPDVYLTQLRMGAPGRLYRNLGDGHFEDVTARAGLDRVEGNGNGAAWVDIDNDGDRDLVVTTIGSPRYFLFVNNGDGTFREDAEARGLAMDDGKPHRGFSVAVGDYDRDGFADLFFTEWESPGDWDTSPRAHAKLMRNRGGAQAGTFEDVTERAHAVLGDPRTVQIHPAYEPYLVNQDKGTYRTASFAASFADLDGDGWPDLVVVSDFGTSQLFWNNGDGTFTDGTSAAHVGKEGNGMGLAIADLNGDGRLDLFVTAIYGRTQPRALSYTGNKLYVNQGSRQFEDMTAGYGLTDGNWGWGTVAGDFDHDGRTDLLMTNGQFAGMYHDILGKAEHVGTPKRLWLNRGDGKFDEVAQAAGLRTTADGKGTVAFDADGDGNLDVLMVNSGQYPTFYRNDSAPDADWVAVRVVAPPGQQFDSARSGNRDGFGAIVTVTDATGRTQRQVIGANDGFLGQGDLVANFGLGRATGPVEITVDWPVPATSAPARTTVSGVRTGQTLEVAPPA